MVTSVTGSVTLLVFSYIGNIFGVAQWYGAELWAR
jgi:hypothetical protein